jgi:hypothetical protein
MMQHQRRYNPMSTCLAMQPAIGAWVRVHFESIEVECEVVDVKNSWGKARLYVKPIAGAGAQWVEMGRIAAVASPVSEPMPPRREML